MKGRWNVISDDFENSFQRNLKELEVKVDKLDEIVDFAKLNQLPLKVDGVKNKVNKIEKLPTDYNLDKRKKNIESNLSDVEKDIQTVFEILRAGGITTANLPLSDEMSQLRELSDFHIGDQDNPHNITAEQIGAVTPAESNDFINEKLSTFSVNPSFNDEEVDFNATDVQSAIKKFYDLILEKLGQFWETGMSDLGSIVLDVSIGPYIEQVELINFLGYIDQIIINPQVPSQVAHKSQIVYPEKLHPCISCNLFLEEA